MNSLYDKPLPENYFYKTDDYFTNSEQGVQFVLEDSKVNKTMWLELSRLYKQYNYLSR